MALRLYPIVLGVLLMGRLGAGRQAVEAAAMLMTPLRLWRAFIFGWMRQWLAIGWLVVFLLCLLDYSIPSLLRRHVFTVEIMSAFNVYYDPPLAMALALPLLLVSLLAAALLG